MHSNITQLNFYNVVKAPMVLIFSLSYPHFKTFGTELASSFTKYNDSNYSKYIIKNFAGLGFY